MALKPSFWHKTLSRNIWNCLKYFVQQATLPRVIEKLHNGQLTDCSNCCYMLPAIVDYWQLVIENPRVLGSIPRPGTNTKLESLATFAELFCTPNKGLCLLFHLCYFLCSMAFKPRRAGHLPQLDLPAQDTKKLLSGLLIKPVLTK